MSTSSTPYTVRYLAPIQQTPDESTLLTNSLSRHLTDHESTLLTDFLSRHLTDRSKWPLDQEQSKHYWASFIYSHGRAGNLFPFVVTHEDPTASASATSDGEGDTGGKVVGVGMYLRKGRLDEADESDPTNWLVTARDSLWNELPSGTSSDGEPIFGRFEPDCDEYEPTIEALDEIPRICTIVVDPAHRLPDRPVERELVKSMLAHLAHNNNHEPSIAAGYNADKELYESEGFKHIWRRELVHPEITNADGTAKPFQELYFVEEVI